MRGPLHTFFLVLIICLVQFWVLVVIRSQFFDSISRYDPVVQYIDIYGEDIDLLDYLDYHRDREMQFPFSFLPLYHLV